MSTTTRMRTLIAGVTISASLAVPLAGAAAASGNGGDRGRGTESVRERSDEKPKSGPASKSADRGSDEGRSRSLEGRAAVCLARVDRRLEDLATLATKVAAADGLTAAHAAAISTILGDTTAGLTALRTQIVAATTTDELAPLCERIVTDFRVYALRIPQVRLVLAADALVAKEPAFAALRVKLADAAANPVDPADASRLAELLATYDRSVAEALAGAAGVADPVLAVTVAAFNADRTVLRPYAAAAKDARRDAKAAAVAARTIVAVSQGDDHADDLPGHDGDEHAPKAEKAGKGGKGDEAPRATER